MDFYMVEELYSQVFGKFSAFIVFPYLESPRFRGVFKACVSSL